MSSSSASSVNRHSTSPTGSPEMATSRTGAISKTATAAMAASSSSARPLDGAPEYDFKAKLSEARQLIEFGGHTAGRALLIDLRDHVRTNGSWVNKTFIAECQIVMAGSYAPESIERIEWGHAVKTELAHVLENNASWVSFNEESNIRAYGSIKKKLIELLNLLPETETSLRKDIQDQINICTGSITASSEYTVCYEQAKKRYSEGETQQSKQLYQEAIKLAGERAEGLYRRARCCLSLAHVYDSRYPEKLQYARSALA
ncbi:MAG TPA: hypothetical protein VIJ14_09330, partial [Rhabdochlamydiaceae bacterium]